MKIYIQNKKKKNFFINFYNIYTFYKLNNYNKNIF